MTATQTFKRIAIFKVKRGGNFFQKVPKSYLQFKNKESQGLVSSVELPDPIWNIKSIGLGEHLESVRFQAIHYLKVHVNHLTVDKHFSSIIVLSPSVFNLFIDLGGGTNIGGAKTTNCSESGGKTVVG